MKRLDGASKKLFETYLERGFGAYSKLQFPDGSMGPNEGGYYNAYYNFALMGRWDQAYRLHEWMNRNMIAGDGLMNTGYIRDDELRGDWRKRSTYFKAWIVYGAHVCGFYDQSLRVADSLAKFIDKDYGGVYCWPEAAEDRRVMCFSHAGSLGRALLAVGKRYEAQKVGEWILHHFNMQPDINNIFYEYMSTATGEVITDPKGEGAPLGTDGKPVYTFADFDEDIFSYDSRKTMQVWAMFGPAFDFMIGLYLMTHDKRYLDAMMKIFELFEKNIPYGSHRLVQSSKILQGLPFLYNETGDERIFDACVELCTGMGAYQDEKTGIFMAKGNYDEMFANPNPAVTDSWKHFTNISLGGDVLIGIAMVHRYLA